MWNEVTGEGESGNESTQTEQSSECGEAYTGDQDALIKLAKEAKRNGLSPEDAEVLREWAEEGGGIHRYSAMSFRSRTDCHADPGAHIDDLLLRLSPARDAIRRVVEQRLAEEPQSVPARLSLYVKSSRSVVGLDGTNAQLTAIGELGAHFGVEVDTDCEDE